MQNTNTQPTAFYTTPSSSGIPPANKPAENTPANSKMKSLFGVVGIATFFLVAIMGVLIAQKQISQKGQDVSPVAPNAPASQPSAALDDSNRCTTTFFVPELTGSVVCDSKVALTDFSVNQGVIIPAGNKFNIGDEFVFRISLNQPGQGVAKNVKMVDTLPDSLQFVADANNTPGLVNNGQTVSLEIPEISPSGKQQIEFKVKVISSIQTNSTNTATVTTNGKDQSSCSYPYSTVTGTVECIKKEMFWNGSLVASGSALTRGREYEYRVTVSATNRSNGDVKVHDMIPTAFTYVRPAAGSERYIVNDPTSGLLIANFGVLENRTVTLGFIVKLASNPALGTITNTAHVYAFPPNSRQPEPPSTADICKVSHQVLPVGSAECVAKEAYTDFGGTKIPANSTVKPGQEFVYRVIVLAQSTTSGRVTVVDKLPTNLIFVDDPDNTDGILYNSSTREVTIDLGTLNSGQRKNVEFKVQVVANPSTDTINNSATVITNGDTQHICELPLEIEEEEITYQCSSVCETNAQCQTANSNYICYDTGTSKQCRLATNPASSTCSPTTTTYQCRSTCTTNAQCQTADDDYICYDTGSGNECRLASNPTSTSCTPTTVTYQCGSPCTTNAQCQTGNTNHVCYDTGSGNECRLVTNPTSTTCQNVVATPPPGCNDICGSNADCSNSSHICVTTADGSNRCRLAEYVNSSTCTVPVIATSTPIVQQPSLPQELPVSGPLNWLDWLKAGLVTLGVGTALFLLL